MGSAENGKPKISTFQPCSHIGLSVLGSILFSLWERTEEREKKKTPIVRMDVFRTITNILV